MVEELAKQETQLRSDKFGFFVWRNCAIGHFKQRREEWAEMQRAAIKKRKMFAEIIEGILLLGFDKAGVTDL